MKIQSNLRTAHVSRASNNAFTQLSRISLETDGERRGPQRQYGNIETALWACRAQFHCSQTSDSMQS